MYAEVLINHAYARKQESFTYEIPQEMELTKGSGVLVPFQRGKQAGIVLRTRKERPEFKTREIEALLNPEKLLTKWQMELAEWISDYYFCSKYDAIRSMLPKHIWRTPKREVSRKQKPKKLHQQEDHELTPTQGKIVKEIIKKKPATSLIHGITGSGKTEVYKKLIRNCVDKEEKQALLLVPEISLTPQLVRYFEGSFPEIAVIHSRISDGKRAEHWRKIQNGTTQLVIGSRSAIFSPFKNLGMIIMDEEHEWSYKQDQSPRYHAREVAKKVSQLTGAQLVLGSATPSIESMWHAQHGDYKLFSMPKRISGTQLPEVKIIDMRDELRAKNLSIFSGILEQKISAALAAKEQVILFLNRRGSASATICRDCGQALSCKNCDVKLTYHARKMQHQTLVCHHCGLITKMPSTCPECQSPRIKHVGVGTERVETELKKLFPAANIKRADRDTMGQKDSFKDLHKALRNQEIDILIGTQMIGKGFDIPNVSLVGVILADLGMHIPDFRATERNFQLLTQVAGRAGRRKKRGQVVIQAYSPNHASVEKSKDHDYMGLYEQEISSRKNTTLPPFGKIIKLIFVNEDKSKCQKAALAIQDKLIAADQSEFKHEIYTAPALTPRMNRKYHWHVLIQGPTPRNLIKALTTEDLEGWRIDVDPVHTV
jgi:primosomal protein N' (replication factor Y) (superfamily II helicase)